MAGETNRKPMQSIEGKLNTARGLCDMAHDTVQLAPSHPLSEALEQLRQAIEYVADATQETCLLAQQAKSVAQYANEAVGAALNGGAP